jgi:hypothetical protein
LFFAEGFGGAFLTEKSSSSSLNRFFLAGGFYSAFGTAFLGTKLVSSPSSSKIFFFFVGEGY